MTFSYADTYGIAADTLPDETPDAGEHCGEMHPEGPMCTRRPAHPFPHMAGNGDYIVAIWRTDSEVEQ